MGSGAWKGGGGDILLINYITTVSPIIINNNIWHLIHILYDALWTTYSNQIVWG